MTKRHARQYLAMLCVLAGVLMSNVASAHIVSVNPGAYAGQWYHPTTGYVSGPQVLDLAAGTHNIVVGEGTFAVSVDGAGNVSVLNGISALGGPGSLTFNVVHVTVDPADFDGYWLVSRGDPGSWTTGVATAALGVHIGGQLAVEVRRRGHQTQRHSPARMR